MKKTISLIALVGLVFGCNNPKVESNDFPVTEMIIKNADTSDVLVYLTIGGGLDSSVWVQNVNGVFGIKDSGLVGSFILKAGESKHYYAKNGKAIQGQFCFNGQAYQCLSDSTYTGSTLTEFCLNNYGTVDNAQETLDISCVAGVSYLAEINMCGGGIWTANYPGYDTVVAIKNDIFGRNTDKVGVFPVGCDDCDSSDAPPQCVVGKGEKPSAHAICQVQRNASNSGGCVTFVYISKPYVICNK
jgi:hypothetical protein